MYISATENNRTIGCTDNIINCNINSFVY